MFRSSANAEWAWYVVQCKPRQEMRALEHLTRQSFETYCPRVPAADAVRALAASKPLFPGYVFVHLAAETNWSTVRATRGVARVVAFNGQPCPVSDELITGIRTRCATFSERSSAPDVRKEVLERNVDALFRATNGTQRVALLMNMLTYSPAAPSFRSAPYTAAPLLSLSA